MLPRFETCRGADSYYATVFTAASHAQRAADFISGLQPAASAG